MFRRPAKLPAALLFVFLSTAGLPALAVTGGADGSTAPPGCREGLTTFTVPVPMDVKVGDNRVNLLLPQGYCSPSEQRTRYPVLYLLHGAGDTFQAWASNTDLVTFSKPYKAIIVMPDGGHNAIAGWYSNWLDGEYQWETYHTSVLPAYINKAYRTIPSDSAIAGLSMGGFGAMSYAARHPGMFKAAASFSGALDMLYGSPVTGPIFTVLHSQYGTPDQRVWGDQLQSHDVWASHNPASLTANLKGIALFLASGTGTPGGAEGDDLTNVGGYGLENGIFQMNRSMVGVLDRAGVPHVDDFYLGGYHGWPYWQADLHWALPQIYAVLQSAEHHP